MPLAEKGVRGKGRQPLSPPQHTETRSANSAPNWGDDLRTPDYRLDGSHLNGYFPAMPDFARDQFGFTRAQPTAVVGVTVIFGGAVQITSIT